jgi:dihydroorotase
VLNLHGEVADISGHGDLSHEEAFLPTLMSLHQRFPNLGIVLEREREALQQLLQHWLLYALAVRLSLVRFASF